jgi:ribA/ribD-fused uncharacterized protein
MPTWAKHMYAKLCNIEGKQDVSKQTLDSLIDGQKLFEERLEGVISMSVETNKMVDTLETQVTNQAKQIEVLTTRLDDMENYSKKYNVKIFNLPESPNEDTQILLQKLSEIMSEMELNLTNFYIDNIHRLPSMGKGPKPVIVKFSSALDKSLFWSRTGRLRNTKLYFKEHFCKTTESNIKTLLPVRKAAKDQNMKVRMSADRLFINDTKYEVKSIGRLPENLRSAALGSRMLKDKLFFYSSSSPLSNFHSSPFSTGGTKFSCREQFIQWRKATLFNCPSVAYDVLKASEPSHMKKLCANLPGFSTSVWKDNVPNIVRECLDLKFKQNTELKEYLVNTGSKSLYEASPYDSTWGIGIGMYDPSLLSKEKAWGSNILGKALESLRGKLNT